MNDNEPDPDAAEQTTVIFSSSWSFGGNENGFTFGLSVNLRTTYDWKKIMILSKKAYLKTLVQTDKESELKDNTSNIIDLHACLFLLLRWFWDASAKWIKLASLNQN